MAPIYLSENEYGKEGQLWKGNPMMSPFINHHSSVTRAVVWTKSLIQPTTDYYTALDRLLDAIEAVLHRGYPLSDELRQRLSNPTLEMLIFDEMTRSLKFE